MFVLDREVPGEGSRPGYGVDADLRALWKKATVAWYYHESVMVLRPLARYHFAAGIDRSRVRNGSDG
jgi:hypothetical protein